MGGGVGLGGGGVQGGCEWRSEAFVKIKKNIFFLGGGGRVRGGVEGGGGQGGCDLRSEAFVKIKKKMGGSGWGGGGVQGGCEWRSEAFGKIKKKKTFFFGGSGMGGSVWM